MTKAELISKVAEQSGQTKVDTAKFLDSFTQVVKQTVKEGEKISIVEFGTFQRVDRAERMGVNPSTKQPIKIEAKQAAKFKPSPNFLN